MTEALVIPVEVYQSLPQLYQAVARLLEEEGKVRIEKDAAEFQR
jgi:hypothetical protein